ncbi:histone-lysine N-methyltransferase SET domain containing [Chlorella sorokiniana]|uniref:Histone-lysine N-methyltransferase SET domain containing n=1 Tax=Chlorella sorokiniana TaxID=3076 RepID=A0A2P6TCT8_CHLSO|nr:histone-lysine N-methyltransferase SET domain containing [Chlorella sorokiniana]|eukprot:PRW20463.1 histone-lysine N-methyltransferase SET domain containing [Chlorella sorokiniana]
MPAPAAGDAMMATGQQIATLLDGMARQLQAGTLDGSYYASMPGLCSTGPQQLSSSERQAVTSLSGAWVRQARAAQADGPAHGNRGGFNLIAAQTWVMYDLTNLAAASGAMGVFAAQHAPVEAVVPWLAAASHLLERLMHTAAGSGDLHTGRFGALLTYCKCLQTLFLDEYARLPQQLLHSASDAAALSRQLCRGAHFLAQADAASPVAAALGQAEVPLFVGFFIYALRLLGKDGGFSLEQDPPTAAHVLSDAFELAAAHPCLQATCLGHPALPALLERCAAEEDIPPEGQAAGDTATRLRSLLDGLLSQAAERSAAEQEQGSPTQLQAAAANLSRLLAALHSSGGDAEGGSSPTQPQQLRQLASPVLLQQAAALAAALAAQTEPTQEQQAADALALARAVAAAPGCNNLACPDWTGEADRLELCEACRTARYCSARCQREAWRAGGHRQCCAALAAERAGERQA